MNVIERTVILSPCIGWCWLRVSHRHLPRLLRKTPSSWRMSPELTSCRSSRSAAGRVAVEATPPSAWESIRVPCDREWTRWESKGLEGGLRRPVLSPSTTDSATPTS